MLRYLGIEKQTNMFVNIANFKLGLEFEQYTQNKLNKFPNSCGIGLLSASVISPLRLRNGHHGNRLGVVTLRCELMSALSACSAARCSSEQMHFPEFFSRCVGSNAGAADLRIIAVSVPRSSHGWGRPGVGFREHCWLPEQSNMAHPCQWIHWNEILR